MAVERIEFEVGDRVVKISNPDRVYFSARGETKLDLANYYLAVADGIVNALYHPRPCMLHRFPDGVDGRRSTRSGFRTARRSGSRPFGFTFPGSTDTPTSSASLHPADIIWAVQMSTVEFHPWNSRRRYDTESPDEWRIDLDPMPAAGYDDVRRVAAIVRNLLDELGAVGYPKTSGGKGTPRLRTDPARARVRRRPPGRLGVRPRGRTAGRADSCTNRSQADMQTSGHRCCPFFNLQFTAAGSASSWC